MSRDHRLGTASEYEAALEEIFRKRMDSPRRRMLLAHYAMPDHIATMRHLAASVDRTQSHSYANLHYGSLAERVRQELGLQYHGLSLYTLATWRDVPYVDADREFSFKLRAEVALAIQRLGWAEDVPNIPAIQRVCRTVEGERREAMRAYVKRAAALREKKIAEAAARSPDGHLRCEVPGCGFDFEDQYGAKGQGYIEVHHRLPLAERSRPKVTTLKDLMLVCANCHKMIHRGGPNVRPGSLIRRRGKT